MKQGPPVATPNDQIATLPALLHHPFRWLQRPGEVYPFWSRPMDLYGVFLCLYGCLWWFPMILEYVGYLFFLISWETKTVKTKLVVERTKKLVLLATKVGYPGVFYDGSRFKWIDDSYPEVGQKKVAEQKGLQKILIILIHLHLHSRSQ